MQQRAIAQKQTKFSSNTADHAVTDRHYPEFGWFRVSKYGTPSGGVAGLAVDINELKQRESDLVKEVERRKELEIEIRKIANTDVLTELSNRRHFMECAKVDYAHAINSGQSIAMMMIDIDDFKSINDRFGHGAGDEVIATTARSISTAVSFEQGLSGRLGGEEFAVLLADCDLHKISSLAEKVRSSIQNIAFVDGDTPYPVTVSIGVATNASPQHSLSELLKDADNALYASKRAGRNRVTQAAVDGFMEFKKTA